MTSMKPSKPGASARTRQVFSRGIYVEALRRLRGFGIALCAACLLIVLTMLMDGMSGPYGQATTVFSLSFASAIAFFTMIASAILMYRAFSFLFKRNSSDFYHGLPCTRLCLCVSRSAAALSWVAAMIGLPLLLCAVMIPYSSRVFPMALLWWVLLYCMATAVLVAGCALIGACLGGRPMLAIAIAGLALFLPRLALTCLRYILMDTAGLLGKGDAWAFLSPAMHLPSAILLNTFGSPYGIAVEHLTDAQQFSYAPGIFYTLAVGVVAMGLGTLLFVRRRSELAENQPPHPLLRYAVQAGFAMGAMMVLATSLYLGHFVQRFPERWPLSLTPGWTFGVLAVALAAYLLYQRIRTRSWRSTAYAAPTMLLAMACVAGVIGIGAGSGQRILHDLPTASEIASVRFPGQTGDADVFIGGLQHADLDAIHTRHLRYDAPEIRAFAAEVLAQTSQAYTATANGQIVSFSYDRDVTMEITTTDGRTLRRTLQITDTQRDLLKRMLLDTPEFVKALRQAPESVLLDIDNDLDQFALRKDAQAQTLWPTLRAELDALSDEEYLRHSIYVNELDALANIPDEQRTDFRDSIIVNAWDGFELASQRVYIDSKLPQTADVCVQATNRFTSADYQAAMTTLQALTPDQHEDPRFGASLYYPTMVDGAVVVRHVYLGNTYLSRDGYYAGDLSYRLSQAHRAELETQWPTVFAIIARSPLADKDGPTVIGARVNLVITDAQHLKYPGTGGVAYLSVSDADYATLTEFANRISAWTAEDTKGEE